jgi:DNA-binding transcriptional LysR family regulator
VQIRQLEDALGVRLLDRNTRSVQLTQVGREVAPVLERLLRELDSLLVNIRSVAAKTSGFVSVAALPSLSATILPAVIAEFQALHSGISIQLRDALGARIAAMVKAGEADFGFGSLQGNEPDIEFTSLFRDRMGVIFLPGSPLEKKKSVSLKDVTALPLILMNRDSSVRNVVEHGLAAIGHISPPAFEAAYMSTALGMVKAGLGVTILPASVLEMEAAGGVAYRPIHGPNLEREIGFLNKRGRSLSPAAEALLKAIRGACVKRRLKA